MEIKKYIKTSSALILAGVAGLVSCSSTSTYNIAVNVDGHSGRVLLLRPAAEDYDTIGNLVNADGAYVFTGEVAEPFEAIVEVVDTRLRIPLFVEPNAEISVEASTDSPLYTMTGGGELQECNARYNELVNASAAERDSITNYYRTTYDLNDPFWVVQLKGALNGATNRFEQAENDFIAANDNEVSASIIARRIDKLQRDKTLHTKYALLGENALRSATAARIAPLAEAIAAISVGGIAPDFTMETPDGGTLSLHKVPGKVKILDFWASWCNPCRAENPNVRKIYERFHDKGLEVISVSLDTDRDRWKNAIEADGMVWLHASELGNGTTARDVYQVYGIPFMLILDENNRIISEGLRGEALEEFIASQFPE